jgi:ribonuclease HII
MIICGIDEAGRGPLAGPVTAAAVVLPADFPRNILADSKALSEKKREAAEAVILRRAVAWGIGEASPEEIDGINILRATLLAMRRALDALGLKPDLVLVDGNVVLDCGIPCEAVVGGDARVPEIMAASILAKTCRDRLMRKLALRYPGYGFEKHKGYPTRVHGEALRLLGPCEIHRRSFRLDFSSWPPPRR